MKASKVMNHTSYTTLSKFDLSGYLSLLVFFYIYYHVLISLFYEAIYSNLVIMCLSVTINLDFYQIIYRKSPKRKYHVVTIAPNPIETILERGVTDTHNTQIHVIPILVKAL